MTLTMIRLHMPKDYKGKQNVYLVNINLLWMKMSLPPEKLPRKVLERAVTLRDPHREIYLALYSRGPSTASEIAGMVGYARAYVHMRLLQLVDMGLVKARRKGRTVIFEVL